jgi:mannan endo-1,4-beta-mannosidase
LRLHRIGGATGARKCEASWAAVLSSSQQVSYSFRPPPLSTSVAPTNKPLAGGGNEFPNSDIPENWACPTLDLIDIHSYSGVSEFKTKAPVALQHALAAKKLVLFEEFGATGSDKASVVKQHIDVFNGLKVPWMIWQINKPGKGAADFEFWTDEETYGVVKEGAGKALSVGAAQSWPNLG